MAEETKISIKPLAQENTLTDVRDEILQSVENKGTEITETIKNYHKDGVFSVNSFYGGQADLTFDGNSNIITMDFPSLKFSDENPAKFRGIIIRLTNNTSYELSAYMQLQLRINGELIYNDSIQHDSLRWSVSYDSTKYLYMGILPLNLVRYGQGATSGYENHWGTSLMIPNSTLLSSFSRYGQEARAGYCNYQFLNEYLNFKEIELEVLYNCAYKSGVPTTAPKLEVEVLYS